MEQMAENGAGTVRKFLDFFGNMGLLARGDRPKVVDLTGREWGEATGGVSLSVRQEKKQDAEELATIAVVLRNDSAKALDIHANGWLAYCAITVTGMDGAQVPLSGYGAQLLQSSTATERLELALAPGAVTETILPVGSLYAMRDGGEYRVRVTCRLADGAEVVSNVATVRG